MFVRWDNLTIDAEEQRRLPGYRDAATVRRFDAPEALDMRFYEVQAKSVLNRVPEKSKPHAVPRGASINVTEVSAHVLTYLSGQVGDDHATGCRCLDCCTSSSAKRAICG